MCIGHIGELFLDGGEWLDGYAKRGTYIRGGVDRDAGYTLDVSMIGRVCGEGSY